MPTALDAELLHNLISLFSPSSTFHSKFLSLVQLWIKKIKILSLFLCFYFSLSHANDRRTEPLEKGDVLLFKPKLASSFGFSLSYTFSYLTDTFASHSKRHFFAVTHSFFPLPTKSLFYLTSFYTFFFYLHPIINHC